MSSTRLTLIQARPRRSSSPLLYFPPLFSLIRFYIFTFQANCGARGHLAPHSSLPYVSPLHKVCGEGTLYGSIRRGPVLMGFSVYCKAPGLETHCNLYGGDTKGHWTHKATRYPHKTNLVLVACNAQ